ncbi:ApeA N-terminal domain 1-containing protein [Rhodanobacter koreensis]
MPKGKSTKLYGSFAMAEGRQVFGDIHIQGEATTLTLKDRGYFLTPEDSNHIFGVCGPGRKISCIECHHSSIGMAGGGDAQYIEMFPHFVVVGPEHVDPAAKVITNISFSTTDLNELFFDRNAFGVVLDAGPIMDTVLAGPRKYGPIEVGEWPEVHYYTGQLAAISVDTLIGKIEVGFERTTRLEGPEGPKVKNVRRLSVTPSEPIAFARAIGHIRVLRRFLSVVAGRPQKIKAIRIMTSSGTAKSEPSKVYWSDAPKGPQGDLPEPSSWARPLDPIKRPEEFSTTIRNWLVREPAMRVARLRFIGCMEKGDIYDIDRIVAAANMFDLLPADASPADVELTPELAAFRDEALKSLSALPQSLDRDRVKGDIGRMVKPSLTHKVLHRWATASKDLPGAFPDMDYVLKQAVKCRNHFVHGGDRFKYDRAEPFVPFLTQTLEFVFAFADLVEAGWSAKQWWGQGSHSDGYPFGQFRRAYPELSREFKAAMGG